MASVSAQMRDAEDLLKHRLAKAERAFPECNPAEGCNGLYLITAEYQGNSRRAKPVYAGNKQ